MSLQFYSHREEEGGFEIKNEWTGLLTYGEDCVTGEVYRIIEESIPKQK